MTRRSFDEQDAEPRLVVGHRLLAIDRDQRLVAADAAEPVEHEVGEEQLPLGLRPTRFDPPSIQPHDEPAAELDPRLARCVIAGKLRKDRRKVRESAEREHRSERDRIERSSNARRKRKARFLP